MRDDAHRVVVLSLSDSDSSSDELESSVVVARFLGLRDVVSDGLSAVPDSVVVGLVVVGLVVVGWVVVGLGVVGTAICHVGDGGTVMIEALVALTAVLRSERRAGG